MSKQFGNGRPGDGKGFHGYDERLYVSPGGPGVSAMVLAPVAIDFGESLVHVLEDVYRPCGEVSVRKLVGGETPRDRRLFCWKNSRHRARRHKGHRKKIRSG